MENQSSTAVPAQSTAKVKGRDYEPPPTTDEIKPYDPAAASKPPSDYDINSDSPGSGEPQS